MEGTALFHQHAVFTPELDLTAATVDESDDDYEDEESMRESMNNSMNNTQNSFLPTEAAPECEPTRGTAAVDDPTSLQADAESGSPGARQVTVAIDDPKGLQVEAESVGSATRQTLRRQSSSSASKMLKYSLSWLHLLLFL